MTRCPLTFAERETLGIHNRANARLDVITGSRGHAVRVGRVDKVRADAPEVYGELRARGVVVVVLSASASVELVCSVIEEARKAGSLSRYGLCNIEYIVETS